MRTLTGIAVNIANSTSVQVLVNGMGSCTNDLISCISNDARNGGPVVGSQYVVIAKEKKYLDVTCTKVAANSYQFRLQPGDSE